MHVTGVVVTSVVELVVVVIDVILGLATDIRSRSID